MNAAAEEPADEPQRPLSQGASLGLGITGVIVGAAGAGLLGGGLSSYLGGAQSEENARAALPAEGSIVGGGDPCAFQTLVCDAIERQESRQTVGMALAIAGGASIVLGTALVWYAVARSGDAEQSSRAPSPSIAIGTNGTGIVLTGAW